MKLICRDGHEREFISLFELYVQKGFDPAFLNKDDGLLSMSNPPGKSASRIFQLAKLGITVEPYLWHYSWLYKKINPNSIAVNEVLDGYKWIACCRRRQIDHTYRFRLTRSSVPKLAKRLGFSASRMVIDFRHTWSNLRRHQQSAYRLPCRVRVNLERHLQAQHQQ